LHSFSVHPIGKSEVSTHYEKVENVIDNVITLDILNYLGTPDRLAELGTLTGNLPKGSNFRHLTDLSKCSGINRVKALPADKKNVPAHITGFLEALTVIGPQLKAIFDKDSGKYKSTQLATANVKDRGLRLVDSGFVVLFQVGKDPEDEDMWIVFAKCYPSMSLDPYKVALRMKSGDAVHAYSCSCTNG
jgi:hypothetical protein